MKARQLSGILGVAMGLLWMGAASAQPQDPYECDDEYQDCGTPQQSGGGGGGGGGSILINNTDLGDTYQYADDYDDDGIEDPYDNCPFADNPDQADDDGDGIGTACDNCPILSNVDQADLDGDLVGDSCDDDMDGDGWDNGNDICPSNPDPLQNNADGDQLGDACDDDMDDDGVPNLEDNCPLVANPNQDNEDPDLWGDACDNDDDSDNILNTYDNCDTVANYDQTDLDGDGLGDACDSDMDGDNVINDLDNCPTSPNNDQVDLDRDQLGDACDDVYCFVVEGDVANCLDPTATFAVYSPPMTATTGEELRLRLFANRINQPLRYTWQVSSAPTGSSATIANPTGAASISTPFEYHYLADRIVTFIPDRPGTYEMHVVAELVWEDTVTGQLGVTAETYSTIEVTGEPLMACNVAPTSGWSRPLAAMLVVLGLALTRRRF